MTSTFRRGNARLRDWPAWVPTATLIWSLVAAAFSLFWAFGGPGFPFGTGDPTPDGSSLEGVRPGQAAPVFAVVSLLAVVVATVASRRPSRPVLWSVLGFGIPLALILLVWLPDARLLMLVGYGPVLIGVVIANAITGWWPDFAEQSPFTDLAMVYAVAGGLLWLATTVSYVRRARDGCAKCGRTNGIAARWTTPESARRWGTWAVVIACLAPLPYPLVRLAWAVGIPLGVDEQFMREAVESKAIWAGAGLGLFAVAGALLTLGLIQRWGERYPRWIWWKKGRPVPMALAIVPATIAAVLIGGGSLQGYWAVLVGHREGSMDLASSPATLFPIWGLALAAATLAYYYRRRGPCATCAPAEDRVIEGLRAGRAR